MAKKPKPRAVVENHVQVAASPAVLWICFADLDKWPYWFPALEEVVWSACTPWTIGAKLRQTVTYGFPLGSVTGVGTVTELVPSSHVVWEGKVLGMEAVHGFRFAAVAGGTEILSRHEFYSSWALLARFLFLTRRVQKIYQAALEGFKAYVERGTIQLRMPM